MTPRLGAALADLDTERSDLLVIGGGITGAGIARDAALRGMRVSLVEARDFGAGTSSRSSRLIHGGLRYLEQGRLRLVRESLAERATLLRLAPHLVRPLPFLLPFFRADRLPAWKARLGLVLYDRLAGRGNVRPHITLGKRALLEQEPRLRTEGLRGGALYHDAQCDDARLTLGVVRAATAAGALVANYARVTGLLVDRGQVTGVSVVDELSGLRRELRAAVVVNAAGPWCDEVRRLESPAAPPLLRPTRGAHILVPQSRLGNRHAILFTNPRDGRVMFVLPWVAGQVRWSYVGTTDTDAPGLPDAGTAGPDPAEVTYLLEAANALFPDAALRRDDVVGSWAGLRPLVGGGADSHAPPSRVSREHRLERGPSGMLTIAGGKLTTFRVMARTVVDRVCRELGRDPGFGRERSDREALPGAGSTTGGSLREEAGDLGLTESTLDYLFASYGGETSELLALCRATPRLALPLHPAHPAIAAQIVFGIRQEFARTEEDLLERRVRLATETTDAGASAASAVRKLLEDYL